MLKSKKVTLEEIGTNWVVRCGTRHLQTQSKAVIGRKKYIHLLKKDFPQWIITNEFPPVVEQTPTTTEVIDGEPFVAIVPEQGEGLLNPPEFSETKVVDASIFGEVTEEDKQNYVKLIDGKFNEAIKTLDSKLDRPADEETGVIENLGQELDQQVKEFTIEEPFNVDSPLNTTEEVVDHLINVAKQTDTILPEDKSVTNTVQEPLVQPTVVIEAKPQQVNSNINPLKQKEMDTQKANEQKAPNTNTSEVKKPNAVVRIGKLGMGYGITSITAPTHFVFKSLGDICYGIADGVASVEAASMIRLGIMPTHAEIVEGPNKGAFIEVTPSLLKNEIVERTNSIQRVCIYPITATKGLFTKKVQAPKTA